MADTTAAQSGSSKQCAAMLGGAHVRVEYSTGRDDEGPFVELYAVHHAGARFPIDYFSDDVCADLRRECEDAEITAGSDDEPRYVTSIGGVQCVATPDGMPARRYA